MYGNCTINDTSTIKANNNRASMNTVHCELQNPSVTVP